jgi:hypothetical protein
VRGEGKGAERGAGTTPDERSSYGQDVLQTVARGSVGATLSAMGARRVRGRSQSSGDDFEDMLQSLCSSEVFDSGIKCFEEDCVKEINVLDNVVTAVVQGNARYNVRLTPPNKRRGLVNYSCTCPYRGWGCCKHVIATIIALSEDFAEEEARRGREMYATGRHTPRERWPEDIELGRYRDEDDAAMARARPLEITSKAIFLKPSNTRRGRKTTQIRTCLDGLMKSVTRLESLALPTAAQEAKETPVKPIQVVADPILSEFATEEEIRRWADPQNYLAGLQYFGEARVSQRKVSGNTISAVVNVRRKGKLRMLRPGAQEYSVSIKVMLGATHGKRHDYQIEAGCGCAEARGSEPCAHVVALLISWARKADTFQLVQAAGEIKPGNDVADVDQRGLARKNAELARATSEVTARLWDLLTLMDDPGCSKNNILTILEAVYARVRLASTNLAEEISEASKATGEDGAYRLEALLGFSLILNVIGVRLFAAVGRRWNVGATTLLNCSTAGMSGGLLDALANSADTRGVAPAAGPDREATPLQGRFLEAADAIDAPQVRSTEGPVIAAAGLPEDGIGTAAPSPKVSRSWDGLVEDFTRE